MKPSTLHNHDEAYEDRNNFLFFLLGLVSMALSLLALFGDSPGDEPPDGAVSTSEDLHNLLR